MSNSSQIETLLKFLDDTGSVISFKYRTNVKSATLKDYVFTKPQWLTEVIYAILESEKPEIDIAYIEQVVAKYNLNCDVWIAIMKEFELIFEIKRKGRKLFVAPQYLQSECDNPTALEMTLDDKVIRNVFTLSYPIFLPKSNFLRFIAKYGSQNINYLYWKGGLVFNKGKTVFAKCINNEYIRKIDVGIQDQDENLTREVFGTLIGIDEDNDLLVSVDEENFVNVKKLQEKLEHNHKEIETVNKKTISVSDFYVLFGKRDSNFLTLQNEQVNQISTMKNDINIFVSYSNKDRRLKELLVDGLNAHLTHHEKYRYNLWSDNEIDLGENWREEINQALKKSNVALLLVSATFASSKFINQVELAEFFKRKKETGCLILPLLVRNYNFQNFEQLSSLNFFKTFYSDYGINNPINRDKIMPFDVLGDDDNVSNRSLNDYYFRLEGFINTAIDRHLATDQPMI